MNKKWRNVVGVSLVLAAPLVKAQASWPTRPITMVVPFAPGGVADAVARPVAEAISRELHQPVVVDNRPGAGGGIGMGYVAKSAADGYTILMALSSIARPSCMFDLCLFPGSGLTRRIVW